MLRRHFVRLVCGAVLALPVATKAQERKLIRVGAVSGQPRNSPYWQSFLKRMGELGYDGSLNFSFDLIVTQAIDGYQVGYRELARRKVDILLASGSEIALKSAIESSSDIPIVMVAIARALFSISSRSLIHAP